MCFEFKHKYVQVPTKWTIKRICLWMIGWNFSAPIKVLDMLLLCTPHVRERSHICWWTFFVINPQRSARPTSLLWRLSVSETGIVDRADQSSYHTLRQIAHGLFGGGWPPFGIQHILQSNSYQPQLVLINTNIHVLAIWKQGELARKGDTEEAETTFA